jgi:cytochrome P450
MSNADETYISLHTLPDVVVPSNDAAAARVPTAVPTRGKLGTALRQIRFVLDPLGTVTQRFARYGEAYRVEYSGGDLFAFQHPDHIKDVLVNNAADFDKQHGAFQTLATILGDALLTSDGERWRRQRRLVQPAFARSRLAQYAAIMAEEAALSAQALADNPRKLDLSREVNALTLRIVTRTLFGQSAMDTARTGAAMLEINRWFGRSGVLLGFLPGARKRFKRAKDRLYDDIDNLIAARRATLDPSVEASDLLSALIVARDEDGASLSPEELRDQLLTLYVAGHETTSHALTWTFYLLSQNPAALERLRAEHARVLGGRTPTFEDMPQLVYTEQVLKEALRLYPPAYVIPRHVHKATQVGPYSLPKDSDVVLWTYVTHRNPRFYRDPEQFRPERFEGAEDEARPKYAYLPFGAGQRACIGQAFAMLEAQLVLATCVQRLDFRYAGWRAPGLATGVTLSPRGGLPMKVSGRA